MRPRPLGWWLAAALATAILALVWGARLWQHTKREEQGLLDRISQRATAKGGTQVLCEDVKRLDPYVILVLGQSNAGNHGEALGSGGQPVHVITDSGGCHLQSDPLPGATGTGATIWSHLPAALAAQGIQRPLLFGVLAVDASSIAEWTKPQSPLDKLLGLMLLRMAEHGLNPDLVVWQQGEADAMAGTQASDYEKGLRKLAAQINARGHSMKIGLALSTLCRSGPSSDIRQVIEQVASRDPRFILGPDTDTLKSDRFRHDRCHLSAVGLKEAAELWAAPIVRLTGRVNPH